MHLAYASTAYGVQGGTVPTSHTLLSDALDSAGIYVGMTRGRGNNRLHIVAESVQEAREQFVAALERDRADRGLANATQAAREAVAGLAADGAVRLVNTERVRLTEHIQYADRQAAKWGRIAAELAAQVHQHRTGAKEHETIVTVAHTDAERVRAEVLAPLVDQAVADGAAYLSARDRMWEAGRAQAGAGRLRRRAAARTVAQATSAHDDAAAATRDRWAELPQTSAGLHAWAQATAQQAADADPRVVEMRERADTARSEQRQLLARQAQERAELRHRLLGNQATSPANSQAAWWRQQAEIARQDLATIEALPVLEAAQLIRDRAARAEAARRTAEQKKATAEARARQLGQPRATSLDRGSTGTERDFGPSL